MSELARIGAAASLTKAHKAAVILAALSSETASAIVQEISDAHLKAFARAFSELKAVPAPLLHVIAQEFVAEVERSQNELAGGVAEAKRMLSSLAEEDRANRIIAELHGGGTDSVWRRLAVIKPELLLPYLSQQRVPIAAAVVSKLPFDQAAALLSLATPDFSNKLLVELSRGRTPTPDVLEAIAAAVEDEFLKPLSASPADGGVNEIVGEIINFLPSGKRDAFLLHLDQEDKTIGAAVRKAVLTFQDIHFRLPEAGASTLLRTVEKETLLVALKFGRTNAPETVAHLLANVSKRMAEQYQEEMEGLNEPSEEDGENAQREIMKILRRLARDGDVKLSPPQS